MGKISYKQHLANVQNSKLGGVKTPEGKEISHYFNEICGMQVDFTSSQFPKGSDIPKGIDKPKEFKKGDCREIRRWNCFF